MKAKSRLIYKTENSCFPGFLPVYFYGMPNGQIVVMYAREKDNRPGNSSLEWVVAEHLEFRFDFKTAAISDNENLVYSFEEFAEYIDNIEQKVRTLYTYGTFYNPREAEQFFKTSTARLLTQPEPLRA